ncbi:hypothetical protein HNP49_000771 [Pseudomonas fluvialis]|uniref:Uncharacterized protein n=1 Tax=Pseudomonas fluvialis TaxID=1793966 RepID=A0A7X0BQU6_9PSED|nr:hypothetical protein [Pseudomonas fluvialis]
MSSTPRPPVKALPPLRRAWPAPVRTRYDGPCEPLPRSGQTPVKPA